jgi:5-methylcytosine-specific restriction endonuclease McrA
MNAEELVKLYSEGNSIAATAKIAGVTDHAVLKALKEVGMKLRSRKQALQKYVKYNDCVICGTRFRARKAWNSGNLYRSTCSDECEFELRSQKSKEKWTTERKLKQSEMLTGRDTIGWHIPRKEERPNWTGGKSSKTFRRIAFEEYHFSKVCTICGSSEDLTIHHKDRNRTNNSQENLIPLCKKCHTKHHNIVGDCGWGLYNSKKYGVKE